MAQKAVVTLSCDLETKLVVEEDVETVTFTDPDGQPREIDLCPKHKAQFERAEDRVRTALAPYVSAGRKPASVVVPPSRMAGKRRGRSIESRGRSSMIRAYAKQNGIEVSDRGRIPVWIVEQYDNRNKPAQVAQQS